MQRVARRCAGVVVLMAGQAVCSWTAAAPTDGLAAFGLIVGLHQDPQAQGGTVTGGPWGSTPDARRALAARRARVDREQASRVAREAGVPHLGVGTAGEAPLLRFKRPLTGEPLQDAMRRLRLHPDVAWVEPDVLLRRQAVITPNDPGWSEQWALGPPGAAPSAIHIQPAWSLATGTPLIHLAVLDTGILPHPDLAGRVLPGHDFVSEVEFAADGDGRDGDPTDPGDWVTRTGNAGPVQQLVDAGLCGTFSRSQWLDPSSWHGTFIAGQLAAATNNANGIAGVTWAGGVVPVRVAGKCGALLSDLLDGMRWAAGLPVEGAPPNANPARVINLSFSGGEPCSRSPAYQAAIDAVTDVGALVVVAAGNEERQLSRPADCQRVLAVGAVRRDGLKTAYSSYGAGVALMAPGGSDESGTRSLLYSTDNSGQTTAVWAENHYGYKQGTSFAAPWASGVAALMLSVNPALTPAQLIDRLQSGVRRWDQVSLPETFPLCSNQLASQRVCRCTADTCGTGLLDADRAVKLAQGPAVVIEPVTGVAPGTRVLLDGASSIAIPGSRIITYGWQQLEGPQVLISDGNTAVAGVTLASAGTYVFELTVTDQQGRTGRDQVRVVVAAQSAGGGGSAGRWAGLALWGWVVALGFGQLRLRRVARKPR